MNKPYEHSSREELIAQVSDLEQTNEELAGQVALLKAELDQLRRLIYGSRSERFTAQEVPEQLQLELGDQPAEEPDIPEQEEEITYKRRKKKKTKRTAVLTGTSASRQSGHRTGRGYDRDDLYRR